jgi:hypothetical protein
MGKGIERNEKKSKNSKKSVISKHRVNCLNSDLTDLTGYKPSLPYFAPPLIPLRGGLISIHIFISFKDTKGQMPLTQNTSVAQA